MLCRRSLLRDVERLSEHRQALLEAASPTARLCEKRGAQEFCIAGKGLDHLNKQRDTLDTA
jgi:hypothetical protein